MRSECEGAHEDNSSAHEEQADRTRAPIAAKTRATPSVPIPFHRGRKRFSSHPKPKSADSARTAAGIAPARMS